MNIARKISSTALSVYQMLYNLAMIIACLVITVMWLGLLLQNTTPWDGISDADGWGILIYGFLLGFGMIFVFVDLIGLIITSIGIVLGQVKIFKSKTRKTSFIFAIINNVCVFISTILVVSTMGTAAWVLTETNSAIVNVITCLVVFGELFAGFWNLVNFVLHLVTDISYFVAEKKKKDGIIEK